MSKKKYIIEYEKDSKLVYTMLRETIKIVARDLFEEYKEDPAGYGVKPFRADDYMLSIQAYNDAIETLRSNLRMHEAVVGEDPPLEL